MTRRETCEDRIDEALENTAHVFTRYMEDYNLYEEGDDEQPPFHEYGLSLEYRDDPRCYEYLLSWGGPSDRIRFFPDGRIEYRFHDWFDGAGRMVTRKPWAQWLYEIFQDCGVFEWPDVYEDGTEEWS